jgi:hypothetical protein
MDTNGMKSKEKSKGKWYVADGYGRYSKFFDTLTEASNRAASLEKEEDREFSVVYYPDENN